MHYGVLAFSLMCLGPQLVKHEGMKVTQRTGGFSSHIIRHWNWDDLKAELSQDCPCYM